MNVELANKLLYEFVARVGGVQPNITILKNPHVSGVETYITRQEYDALNYLLEAGCHFSDDELEHYAVAGAGTLEIGQPNSHTGSATGLTIGCSWGRYGYAGGVLDWQEVEKLANFLNKQLSARVSPTFVTEKQP